MSSIRRFTVDTNNVGNRIDIYLVTKNSEDLNRSNLKKLFDSGKVKINGETAKSSSKLKQNDNIQVEIPNQRKRLPEIDLPILYEDDNCIVIDKPAGVLTHSKGAFNPEATVESFIAPKLSDIDGERAGIVHRLDRGTSGVIICAKNQATHKYLQKQFAQRKVKKTYLAIIEGMLSKEEAIIDGDIERNPKKPQSFRVGSNGKSATTAYKVLACNEKFSLVELKPTTGRTHQLRVHMSSLGHPIVGDTMYGGKEDSRLMLHASGLEITLTGGIRKTFTSATPKEFEL